MGKEAIVFAILLVWALMGFLMIKGNDHCCPNNRKICESDAGTMFSQSSVDLSREVMQLSHDSQRTCANYYDLDIDRCTQKTTGEYCHDIHTWQDTQDNQYCYQQYTSSLIDAIENSEGFDKGRTKAADVTTFTDNGQLSFCALTNADGQTGTEACCICGGGNMMKQEASDVDHKEACCECGGGTTTGCQLDPIPKCGYNADVARPAFAVIGGLITIVLLYYLNQSLDNEYDEIVTAAPNKNMR